MAEVRRDEENGEEGGEESGPKLVPPPTEDVTKPAYKRKAFNGQILSRQNWSCL